MAAAGYTPISLYYSSTATNTPLAANLTNGELAINITDGKLYYKDNAGAVQLLASKATTAGAITAVSVVSANGLAGTSSGGATPALTLSTTVTGLLKGNGTAISAATSGTDYAPATSGTSILYGNGSGGFSSVTIGSGVSFAGGTLSATGSGGTVTSVGASFTGGVVSVAGSPVTGSGTLAFTIAGTSGGIPYFSSATGWASSAALAANSIVLGGGAGVAPSTTTTGTGVVTALGQSVTGSGGIVLATSPTLVTPTLGVASATTVNKVTLTAPATGSTLTIADGKTLTASNSITLAGTDSTTMTFPLASASVGYLNIPINSQSAAYTTVLADSGKAIFHPSTDANARTFTIDSNANVAYALGTAITFINMTSQVVTIAITSDTMYLAGTGTTGSRSLAQYGMATAVKMTSTTWIISGNGVT